MSFLLLISPLSCATLLTLVTKVGIFLNRVNFVDLSFNDANIRFFNFTGVEGVERDFNPTWHNHKSYELHFSFAATVNYKFADRKITLNPGEMLIIPPSVDHESVVAKYPKKDFATIAMEIKKLNAGDEFYENFTCALGDNALTPIKIPEHLRESIFVLENAELYTTMLGVCKLKTAVSQMVYMLFKKIMTDKPVKNENVNQKVLIDLMIFEANITLDKIALATNYSKRQLSRIIKEQYGMTFSQIRRGMLRDKDQNGY